MDERAPSSVAEVGELGLIERVRARLGFAPEGEVWAGDDTAVVVSQGPALLVTTDLLVEGIDFVTAYCTGADVGWKALAASASDIAAMCGRPSHAVVALGVPAPTPVAWIDEFLDGLTEGAGSWEIALVGGDVSAAEQIVVTVSMLGVPLRSSPVLRSGARLGDSICVTGALGGAAAGLIALRSGAQPDDQSVVRLIERQLRPRARVAEAAILSQFEISAMIDVSDGLVVDLGHLLDESGVGCHIDEGAIPIDPDISSGEETNRLELALLGGEDFELLFTMHEEQLAAASDALEATGTALTAIGSVTTGERRIGRRALDEWRQRGWEHLRGP